MKMSTNGANERDVWTNLGFRAFTKIDRPDPAIAKALLRFSSCDLSDVMFKAHTMVGLRAAYTPVARVAGPAVTVSVPSGALNTIKYAANLVQPGDVLVVNAQGDTTYALWGGNVSRGLQARGAAALVMDGAVRDVAENPRARLSGLRAWLCDGVSRARRGAWRSKRPDRVRGDRRQPGRPCPVRRGRHCLDSARRRRRSHQEGDRAARAA